MADSILRLKVESQEYDAKIKRASEGIQKYADGCRKAGLTLEFLDDGVLEFVQALGQMDTVSQGTRQKLREMSNALTSLTEVYRGLSDAEKTAPFGQELAKQIDILTERAGEAKDAMLDVEQTIKNAASDTRAFDQVAQGVTMLTSTMQTAQGAAKLLGIELGDNVEVIAKLQAAMAVTSGLQEMQNLLQKQSALMQGVNALQKEFNLLARANPYVLLATGVAAVAAAYLLWAKNGNDAKRAQAALNSELNHTKEQLSHIDRDTDFSVGIAEAAGKSWKAIHELRLEAARTKLQLADMNYDKLAASGNATAEQMKEAAKMQKDAWDSVMKVLNEGTIHDVKMRYGGGRSGGGGGSSATAIENVNADSIAAQRKFVQELTTEWENASGKVRDDIKAMLDYAQQQLAQMTSGWASFVRPQDINTKGLGGTDFNNPFAGDTAAMLGSGTLGLQLDDSVIKKVNEQLSKTQKMASQTQKAFSLAAEATSNLGAAFAAIEDPAAKAAGTVMQAIASIALGFAQAAAAKDTTASGWAWLAWLAAGTAAMATTISTVHSLTGYAEGGMVKGNTYSGDQIPIMANAGEVILNRAQQNNIANALEQPGGGRGGYTISHVSGEQIWIALNAFTKRTGRGELVTWR